MWCQCILQWNRVINAKISGSLWKYSRNKPDDDITDSKSFKFKPRFTNNTGNAATVNAEKAVPLNTKVIFGELLKYH